jgi:hypothetical protein
VTWQQSGETPMGQKFVKELNMHRSGPYGFLLLISANSIPPQKKPGNFARIVARLLQESGSLCSAGSRQTFGATCAGCCCTQHSPG